MSDRAGYVYVLTNPSMPNLVKIGRSKHGGRIRAKEIFNQGSTGVPEPFSLEFEVWTDDCIQLEADVHYELARCRVHPGREFFRIMHYDAVQVILQIFGSYSALVVDKEDCCISGSELDDMRTARVDAIIEDKFMDFPLHSIALSSAIRTQLTDDELCALLERYADAINDEIRARQEEKLPGITQIRAGEKQ